MANQNVDLKRAGLKVTLPRINILSILSESTDEGAHLSAEDVYQRLRDAGDDVGLNFRRALEDIRIRASHSTRDMGYSSA